MGKTDSVLAKVQTRFWGWKINNSNSSQFRMAAATIDRNDSVCVSADCRNFSPLATGNVDMTHNGGKF